jgi:hypothetical protein
MKTVSSIKEAYELGKGSYIAAVNPFNPEQYMQLNIWETDEEEDEECEPGPYIHGWFAEGAVCTFSKANESRSLSDLSPEVRKKGYNFEEVCRLLAQKEPNVAITTVDDGKPNGAYCTAVWEKNPGDLRRAVQRWLEQQ